MSTLRSAARGVTGTRYLGALIAWLAGLLLVVGWAWSIETGAVLVDEPETVVAAALRYLVVAVGAWCIVGAVIALVGAVLGDGRVLRLSASMNPAFISRLTRHAAAVSISTMLVAAAPGVAGALSTTPHTSGPTPRQLDVEFDNRSPLDDAPPTDLRARMTLLDGARVAKHTDAPGRPDNDPTRPAERANSAHELGPVLAQLPNVWVVQPGQSFWSKAQEVTGAASTEELTTYWQRLIDINRDLLIRPDDPNFLLPGQQLRLPPPAGS